MLSMDPGLVLPPEMSAPLAVLRAEAPPMPPRQMQAVLHAQWGAGWYDRFQRFDLRPFAAASIGQVHRAVTADGRTLAVKVQYPGIRASIDSDLANMATLLRLPGLVPAGIDLGPLLAEARRQLHHEADYRAEARSLAAFGALLQGDDRFVLPTVDDGLSTGEVLAMTYVDSQPIDTLGHAPQDLRDRVAGALIALCLKELFEFGLMQTDPNLANYRIRPETGQIVLLDFGAVAGIAPPLRAAFRDLLRAALGDDPATTRAMLWRMGYLGPGMTDRHQNLIHVLFDRAMAPLRQEAPFDFAASPLLADLRDAGMDLALERDLAHVPPPETLFIHRKIGGLYLMCARLGARVALRPLVGAYL